MNMETYGPFTSIPCAKHEHKGALKIEIYIYHSDSVCLH